MPLEHHTFERGSKIGHWIRTAKRKEFGEKLAASNRDAETKKQRTSTAERGGVGLKNLATVDRGGRDEKNQPS